MILGNPSSWNGVIGPREERSKHERRDRYRAPLNIPTPDVDAEQHKRWHGAPPSRPKISRREGGPISF